VLPTIPVDGAWRWVGATPVDGTTSINVPGTGLATVFASAVAGVGKPACSGPTFYYTAICTQVGAGALSLVTNTLFQLAPSVPTDGYVGQAVAMGKLTINKGTTYTIGMCIQITGGVPFTFNSQVQGYVQAF
jgi:hypothetical protein